MSQSNVATLPTIPADDAEARERAELEQRIEAARAARARVEAERERRERARALAAELEREERALKDEQAIADAEEQYGPVGERIEALPTRMGVVIVRRPHPANYRKFADRVNAPKGFTTDDCEQLVRSALVYPDRETFDRWAKEQPAIIPNAANACTRLAGARSEELSGK